MIDVVKGAILILSGPSGCGKSTLLKHVYKEIEDYYFSISTTTRAKREGETEGIDYFFVSIEEFKSDIENDNFLEWALVHGNYYGTSLNPINKALKKGKLVIFDIDVQGHDLVRTKLNDIVTSVFITTPNLTELEKRLYNRKTDIDSVIMKRILNARKEINFFNKYDYFIINDNLKNATKNLVSVANIARIKSALFNKINTPQEWLG